MGTDNLFHKRNAKKAAELKRGKVKREAYAKVLIVCEGQNMQEYAIRPISFTKPRLFSLKFTQLLQKCLGELVNNQRFAGSIKLDALS